MRTVRWIWIWSLSLLLWSASASCVQLFVWRPLHNGTGIVLGAKDGETFKDAARRFVTLFTQDSELKSILERNPFPNLPLLNFEPLKDSDFKHRILILANMPKDLTAEADRVKAVVQPAMENGANVYIVPPAADLGLDPQERDEFIQLLNWRFMSFVAIGGDDIDRRVFGEANTLSLNVNFRRDQFEAALIQRKVQSILKRAPGRKDRFLGICRGAQLAAKVMGYRIGDDIPIQVGNAVLHGSGVGEGGLKTGANGEITHPIEIVPTDRSLVFDLVGRQSKIQGNSFHHQWIVYPPEKPTWVTLARSGFSPADGITEWMEYDDSIILSQMHPELMALRGEGERKVLGRRIMNGLIEFLTPMRDRCAMDLGKRRRLAVEGGHVPW